MADWLNRINQIDMEIITGDGKGFLPKYLTASVSKHINFNTAGFDFKDVEGSLIIRGKAKGTQYNLEIIFDGPDCLDTAAAFVKSSKDNRPWTITHPMYGSLYVQPSCLTQDNGALNLSKISADITETILESGATKVISDPQDSITAAATQVAQNFNKRLVADLPDPPKTSFIQNLLNHVNAGTAFVLKKIAFVQSNVNTIRGYYNKAIGVIQATITDAQAITNATTDLILEPANFTDTVVNRLAILAGNLDIYSADIARILAIYGFPEDVLEQKLLYENNAGITVAAMCLATVNNVTNDYNYRPDVLNVIQTIVNAHNSYIANLYGLQSANGGDHGSYIPDPNSLIPLANLVDNTINMLLTVSAGALQQRVYILPYDDNLILITKKLYGLDPDDSKKLALIANNDIGKDEILLIKKDRRIVYYV